MTLPYVCASCSRRILQYARRQLLAQTQQNRASYITLGGGQEETKQIRADNAHDPAPKDDEKRGNSRRTWREVGSIRPPRSHRSVPTLDLLQSAEDEFLERLLSGRESSKAAGPYSTPSVPRRNQLPQDVPIPRRSSKDELLKPPGTQNLRPLPSHIFSPISTSPQHAAEALPIEPNDLKRPPVPTRDQKTISALEDDERMESTEEAPINTEGESTSIQAQSPPAVRQLHQRDASARLPSEMSDIRSVQHPGRTLRTDTHVSDEWQSVLSNEDKVKGHKSNQPDLSEVAVAAIWCESTTTVCASPSSVLQSLLDKKPSNRIRYRSWLAATKVVVRHSLQCLSSDDSHLHVARYFEELYALWSLLLHDHLRVSKSSKKLAKHSIDYSSWQSLDQSPEIVVPRDHHQVAGVRFLNEVFPLLRHRESRWGFGVFMLMTMAFFTKVKVPARDNANIEAYCNFASRLLFSDNAAQYLRLVQRELHSLGLPQKLLEDLLQPLQALCKDSIDFDQLNADNQLTADNQLAADHTSVPKQKETRSLDVRLEQSIGRAIEQRNGPRLDSLWHEFLAAIVGTSSTLTLSRSLYSQFLTAFMALERPDRAIEVWNVMVKQDVTPGVGAWDAMLKGCGIARDAKAVDEIWSRFLQSGTPPDVQIWTTRIHALTTSGHWESGLAAFREMASNWINAVQSAYRGRELPQLSDLGDINDVPKPNTNTLNGLITGLARGKKTDQIQKLLNWARALGIALDSYSFNPILGTAVRRGDLAAGFKVLDEMRSLSVTPDIATYTLLLQLLFRTDQGHSHESLSMTTGDINSIEASTTSAEQVRRDASAHILQTMHESGLEANAYTYAALVNGLLRNPFASDKDNLEAAYSVIGYMEDHSIPMSSQVYTNFLTHHFNTDPPDMVAIESLWSRARQDRKVHLDAFFFDRLIEGFARCGAVGKMMTALGQASKRGKVPSWRAMTEVIRALAQTGDYGRAEDIVRSVSLDNGTDSRRSHTGRTTFWDTVRELGLRHDQIPSESHEAVQPDRRAVGTVV